MQIRTTFLNFLVILLIAVVSGGKSKNVITSTTVRAASKTAAGQMSAAERRNKYKDLKKSAGDFVHLQKLAREQTKRDENKIRKETINKKRSEKIKKLKKQGWTYAKKAASKTLRQVNILPGLVTDIKPALSDKISNHLMAHLAHVLGETTTGRYSMYDNMYDHEKDDVVGKKTRSPYDSDEEDSLYAHRRYGDEKLKAKNSWEGTSDEDEIKKENKKSQEKKSAEANSNEQEKSSEVKSIDSKEKADDEHKVAENVEKSTAANKTVESTTYHSISANKTFTNLDVQARL